MKRVRRFDSWKNVQGDRYDGETCYRQHSPVKMAETRTSTPEDFTAASWVFWCSECGAIGTGRLTELVWTLPGNAGASFEQSMGESL